jgi:membrane-associated phospholipid phosphatase
MDAWSGQEAWPGGKLIVFNSRVTLTGFCCAVAQADGATRWLNGFDVGIERYLNHFVGSHRWFDWLMAVSAQDNLIKGGVVVFLMWLVLLDKNRPGELRDRSELLLGAGLFATVATLIARLVAHSLPFRERPFLIPAMHFRQTAGAHSAGAVNWSSFPSDHATLFAGLAAGIFMVSRRVGWFAAVWVAVVTCFSRMYLGLHWPTDILAGALIGVACVQMARVPAIRAEVAEVTTNLRRKHPGLFWGLFFLWSYETVFLYMDLREFAKMLKP